MKLQSFQVFKYRNIIDSGEVKVRDVVTLVGQNECGKSNLLQALYKFSPLDDAEYDLNRDWPIDEWANKKEGEKAVVCKAEFSLLPDEIKEMFSQSTLAEEEATPEEDSASVELAESELPASVTATVEKTYSNEFSVTLPTELYDQLDPRQAARWVIAHLPKCVYMGDYQTFRGYHPNMHDLAQRISDPNNITSEERTLLIALDLAVLDLHDLVQKDPTDEGKRQRQYDTNAASRHLSKLFEGRWDQKNVKFDIRVDGPRIELFVEDEGLDAFVPLEARSRGLQWYVSFVWRFMHASQGEFANCILLLDEPGIHLHHDGHKNLLNFLRILSETNTLIYTTHLGTMIDERYPEWLRIMEVHDHHAFVLNSMVSSQKKPMMVIEARLGLAGKMSGLLGSRQNLIVEGATDVIIIEKLSAVLQNSGETGLSDRIFLISADGASKTPLYAGFMVGNKFHAAVLLDSDEEGEKAKKKIKHQFLDVLANESGVPFRVLMLGEVVKTKKNAFEIEDMFPVSFYLECVNEAYGTNLDESDLPVDGDDRITKRVESVLKDRGRLDELDKEPVLKAILARFAHIQTKDDLPQPSRTHVKARKIIDKINEVFA